MESHVNFYACFECPKTRTFETLHGLHIHQSRQHKTRCDECGEIFSSPEVCDRHKSVDHHLLAELNNNVANHH
jgi:hypothetical protein